MQVDVGFGDAVTPAPEPIEYPTILPGLPAPRLRAYPRYTVVAEKLKALVSLGIANSRIKDYFDLWVLASHTHFDGDLLTRAIGATFDRRATPIPDGEPFGLSAAFAQDSQKQTQWRAFLTRNALASLALADILDLLRGFLMPPLQAARTKVPLTVHWTPGNGWC